MRTLKQKKRNRLLAALLAVAMMFQMLPLMAFADGGTGSTAEKVRLNGKYYDTLQQAIDAAGTEGNGYTIYLGKGKYSLTGNEKIRKSLTFVGAGIGETEWQIRAPEKPYGAGDDWHDESDGDGADGWCDYSFDGSDSITFQDMTVIGSVDPYGNIQAHNLQGFIRVQHITLENCDFNGRADYWGYASTTFNNVTFHAPGTAEFEVGKTDYSVWTYTGTEYTFNNCTFYSNGKTVNVYRTCDPRTDPCIRVGDDVTVNFNNCTVYSPSTEGKQALKIDDTYMGNSKFILNITNPQVTATREKITCSQVFGFGGKEYCNTGKTDVKIDGKLVWSEKRMLTHSYTDGEKDQAYDTTYSAWRQWDERNDERDVARKCKYCGWEENYTERASVYRLQYDLNGGTGAEGANYDDAFYHEKESVALAAAPSCEGYDFVCWKDAAGRTYSAKEETVLKGDTVLTAQWGKEPPEKPEEPKAPEESGCGVVSTVLIAAGTTAIGYYAGTQVLKHCYGLPYWPGNRSVLALMLWEDAGKPMPSSALLYPDVGQEERDMDLQHAARWAMENELIPDLNLDDSKPEEEQKFFPNYAVSRAWALHAWNKAQKLKKNA